MLHQNHFIFCISLHFFNALEVLGHGRLLEPPGRSSLWRFPEFAKYNPPENFNDNELNCGGYHRQFKVNKGRCGPCGDPYDAPVPRENETGGKYGRGITVRDYKSGQVINVTVQLTASHRGYFQFRICNPKDPKIVETQPCFNENVLQLGDGSGETKYRIDVAREQTELFNFTLQLPRTLTCAKCILQWHYRTGNSFGTCTDGTMAVGCGNQEVFRACAEISVKN